VFAQATVFVTENSKYSSLVKNLFIFVNYESVMFYSTRANVIKLFNPLFIHFCTKIEVCWTRLEKLARDKHSSLVQKFVNYEQKKFYDIGPWGQCY
jgi:hypothetical protein